jgi:hypothetical protein
LLSGTLTRESLISVFKALSLKQRQGILEVTIPSSYYELCFHDGVVVEVKGTEDSVARLITSRLLEGGYITKELTAALSDVELTVDQLYEFLVGDEHVDQQRFVSAKRAVEHDIIIYLSEAEEGFFNFTPKLIQFRPELSMAGSPGHLLLDVFEYDNDRERFEEIFEDVESSAVFVCKTGELSTNLTDAEKAVWSQIQVEESIKQIYQRALLGVYDLQQALLSLYDRNLIGVAESEEVISAELDFEQVEEVEDEDVEDSGVTDTLRLKVQKEHTDPPESNPQASNVLRTPVQRAVQPEKAQPNVETLIDKAVSLLRGMDASIAGSDTTLMLKDVEESFPSLFIDEDIGDLSLASDEASGATLGSDPKSSNTTIAGPTFTPEDVDGVDDDDGDYEDDDDDDDCSVDSLAAREGLPSDILNAPMAPAATTSLDRLNNALLETPVAYNMGVILVLIFLVSLAFVAPDMLDSWFEALGAFSSK